MVLGVETQKLQRDLETVVSPAQKDAKARLYIGAGMVAMMLVGLLVAYLLSQTRLFASTGQFGTTYQSHYYILLTKTPAIWLIAAAPFLGILIGSLARQRIESTLEDGKIRRNDAAGVFLEHWTVALSGVILLITGLLLGALFIPRTAGTREFAGFAINTHLIGVVLFLFGSFYHITNHVFAGDFNRITPTASDVGDAIGHYLSKLGIGKHPEEGKYLASQKFAYIGASVMIGLLIITGAIKVAAHVFSLPGELMAPMTFIHDLMAVVMIAFLVIHLLAGSILPSSWPLLKSLFTGYMSEEYAAKHHPKWLEEAQKRRSSN